MITLLGSDLILDYEYGTWSRGLVSAGRSSANRDDTKVSKMFVTSVRGISVRDTVTPLPPCKKRWDLLES